MSILKNLPICDLRNYTDIAAINEIEEIKNVALLIMPRDASPEVMAALTRVEKKNIAVTISLTMDQKVNMLNGNVELTDANFSKDGNSVVLANGNVIIRNISPETRGELIVNGKVLFHDSLKGQLGIDLMSVNGQSYYKDFSEYKFFGNDLVANDEFFSYLQPKTALEIGNCLKLEENVRIETLKQQSPIFIVGGNAYCSAPLIPYLRATAEVNGEVKPLEQYEEDKNREASNHMSPWMFD